jgi:hypothetical protein
MAVLIDIIEPNEWQRPIHFSAYASYNEGLKKFFQLHGITYKLLPVEAEKYGIPINMQTTEEILLNKKNIFD